MLCAALYYAIIHVGEADNRKGARNVCGSPVNYERYVCMCDEETTSCMAKLEYYHKGRRQNWYTLLIGGTAVQGLYRRLVPEKKEKIKKKKKKTQWGIRT